MENQNTKLKPKIVKDNGKVEYQIENEKYKHESNNERENKNVRKSSS